MDWARAKTILIVTLLLLNIFLFVTILYTNSGIRFQSEYTRYAREYLESRNIQIDERIPDIRGKAEIINYPTNRKYNLDTLSQTVFGHKAEKTEEDGEVVIREGEEKIILNNEVLFIKDQLPDGKDLFIDLKGFSEKVLSYLKDLGYSKNTLSLQALEETDDIKRMTYVLTYKNGLLFDKKIMAELSKEGVLTLSLTAKEAKPAENPETFEVMSAYQVLVMGNLPTGTHIKSIHFGYRQIRAEELYDSPVWRFILEDGTTLFFNANTGERLQ